MRTSLVLLVVLFPLLAQGQGAALAKKLESEKDPKQQAKLLAQVEGLESAQKDAFVSWARARRESTKLPWKRLGRALGKIGTQAAANELGEVARFVNKTEVKGLSRRIKSALEALTSIAPDVAVPILLKGFQHTDREVQTRHRKYLTRFAAEGVAIARDGALRELTREARRLQEKREELLEEEEEDVDKAAVRRTEQLESRLMSVFTDAVEASNHPRDHLRFLAVTDQPRVVLIGTIRGIAKRGESRLAPLKRAIRKLRTQIKREAKRTGMEVEPLSEEAARRRVFRAQPRMEALWKAVQAELPELERHLATLAEHELPEIHVEIAVALPAVRRGLTQAWADVLFPLLESPKMPWIVSTGKALADLTGQTKLGQSRKSWEAWWKTQEGAEE